MHQKLNPFSQLPAVKKDSKNGAARKNFGPSYFVTSVKSQFPLVMTWKEKKVTAIVIKQQFRFPIEVYEILDLSTPNGKPRLLIYDYSCH